MQCRIDVHSGTSVGAREIAAAARYGVGSPALDHQDPTPDMTLHTIPVPPLAHDAPGWQRAAHRVCYSAPFQSVIMAIIVLNAIGIGIQTYSGIPIWLNRIVEGADVAFILIFSVELVLRFVAHRANPIAFFKDGWNLFDTLVIGLALVPGVSSSVTALRVVRLLRVARLLRIMPDIRVLMDGMRRATGPAASLLALTVLLCYMYAVLGNLIFAKTAPEYFGNLGEGMLTLFELLTLEGWNEILNDLRAASPLGLVFTIVFVLFGTYIVVNFVVGVVITSLEDAYQHKKAQEHNRSPENDRDGASRVDLGAQVDQLQASLDLLNLRLAEMESRQSDDETRTNDPSPGARDSSRHVTSSDRPGDIAGSSLPGEGDPSVS